MSNPGKAADYPLFAQNFKSSATFAWDSQCGSSFLDSLDLVTRLFSAVLDATEL